MDHVVAPLAPPHAEVVARLSAELAATWGGRPAVETTRPHITLVSFSGLPKAAALDAIEPVARSTSPFTVRAHAYGIFTGGQPNDLSLHVMVVRTSALDALHTRVGRALRRAGARIDGVTEPRVWTPHITLLDRDLTPRRLARAVEVLACRPHCSWEVAVTSIAVGARSGSPEPRQLALGTASRGNE